MRWLIVILFACDPGWNLTAHVVDDTGAPIEGAALSMQQCDAVDGSDPEPSQANLTDATGSAWLGDLGTQFPPCDFTVAKAGFEPFSSSFSELCEGKLDDCYPVRTIPVVLSGAL